ncbi:MAG: hypothetical protein AAF555_03850 [Verrucomicrobiota bacterium]
MSQAPKKRSCFLPLLVVLLLLAGGVALAWWWFHRPIDPVVLTPPEKKVVEEKLQEAKPTAESAYRPGAKEIVLTQREINGLLNEYTEIEKEFQFQFEEGEVFARLRKKLGPEVPFLGGRTLAARARFLVREVKNRPVLILDDVTVWGVSLPNEWLGEIKGKDLLGEMLNAAGGVPGVEGIRVEKGRMILRLAD